MKMIIFILVIFTFTNVEAGELHDFEKDATLKRGSDSVDPDQDRDRDDCGIIWLLLFACGNYSIDDSSVVQSSDHDGQNINHLNSSTLARVDVHYQNSTTDVSSLGLDFEASKNNFGFHAKIAEFSETSPNDDLSFFQFHGLFQPNARSNFSLALGVGLGILSGEHNTTGISFFIPAKYKLNNIFSFEASGSITSLNKNPIIDTKISVKTSYKRISFLMSYMSLISPNESIHGPSIGLSLQI